MKRFDVIVIGAGLSGLTAAALLAKRGRTVLVVEAQDKPGGSCGIFKRDGSIFEQGVAMLYGFSDWGFNPDRFLFNVLAEPITLIKHENLYMIHFGEDDIIFYEDLEKFINELIRVFPDEEKGIRRFYRDMSKLYKKVIADTPLFVSPDVLNNKQAKDQFMKHPISYIRFLSYMNQSMKTVLRRYFKGDKILEFFDKMTSTYCYATVEEAPAVLGAVMFIDNHYGGSYYPAGSTMQFVGKLEKVIEENDGELLYGTKVSKICINDNTATGIVTDKQEIIEADQIIYGGNIWSLYDDLLERKCDTLYEPTYGSMVLYALIKEECVPEDVLPIEMFISNKSKIDESEITTYIMSIDDKTLCPSGYHVLTAIGPSFNIWPKGHDQWHNLERYSIRKEAEKKRMVSELGKRFKDIEKSIVYCEVATPSTLEHYALKFHGSVAGPKQMLGQHMLKRQHTQTEVNKLYCCGEGTVMGTGVPAVTVSGISAANLALREAGVKEYDKSDAKENFVTVIKPPFIRHKDNPELRCEYCQHPKCETACPYHIRIRDINRKLSVGNIAGADKLLNQNEPLPCITCIQEPCMKSCVRRDSNAPVPIKEILIKQRTNLQ